MWDRRLGPNLLSIAFYFFPLVSRHGESEMSKAMNTTRLGSPGKKTKRTNDVSPEVACVCVWR
jgi:hypothetical protein